MSSGSALLEVLLARFEGRKRAASVHHPSVMAILPTGASESSARLVVQGAGGSRSDVAQKAFGLGVVMLSRRQSSGGRA
jgi:hypothetical protein